MNQHQEELRAKRDVMLAEVNPDPESRQDIESKPLQRQIEILSWVQMLRIRKKPGESAH